MEWQKKPQHRELARRIFAAFASYHGGVPLAAAYKKIGKRDVGGLYYFLADWGEQALTKTLNEPDLLDMPLVTKRIQ